MIDNIVSSSWQLRTWLQSTLESSNIPEWLIYSIDFTIRAFILLIISRVLFWASKKVLLHYAVKLVNKTKSKRDDFLIKRKVLHRFSHVVPAIFIYLLSKSLFAVYPEVGRILTNFAVIYMVAVIFLTISALLNVVEDIYNTKEYSAERPIKSYLQLINIILYFVGGILLLAYLFNLEVAGIFTGLGAMAAVLMLIFKDTILGLVASIQLSTNKMLRVGDWISMPSHNADGDVLEVTLNTVKVQNWDKTITTIPTYALINSPFMNWRGMSESGGRRIKRSINIDMRSVKLCDEKMIAKFKKIHHLQAYIEEREAEIDEYNKINNVDKSVKVNGRRMTNLGVFRKYLENYCSQHPGLNQEMTLLVRHLQPTEKGIPIELYVFTASTKWAIYEGVQADIFDHILAVIPEFELSVFQEPSGDDLQSAVSGLGEIMLQNKQMQ